MEYNQKKVNIQLNKVKEWLIFTIKTVQFHKFDAGLSK